MALGYALRRGSWGRSVDRCSRGCEGSDEKREKYRKTAEMAIFVAPGGGVARNSAKERFGVLRWWARLAVGVVTKKWRS